MANPYVSLIRHDMETFRSCLGEAEARISQAEDTIRADSREIHALQIQVKALQDKAVDTENRLRRNNLRIQGLPERAEGPKQAEFADSFLTMLFGLENLPASFVMERAHRVQPTPPIPEAPRWPFLLRLLNYRDRDTTLSLACKKQALSFNNNKISIFPDYSPEVQQRHRSGTEVRKRLREKGLAYSLLFPSKLRIIDGDRFRFFVSAPTWLDARDPS